MEHGNSRRHKLSDKRKKQIRKSIESITSEEEPRSSQSSRASSKQERKKSKTSRTSQSPPQKPYGADFVSVSDDEPVIETGSSERNSNKKYEDTLGLTPDTGSVDEGEKLFEFMIKPISVETFMSKYFEQKPIRVQRHFADYYKDLISTEGIDQLLRDNHLEYTKNVDITKYENGVRKTLTPVGRAMSAGVWAHYNAGCSIRLLNPQTFVPAIHSMNATLQEYFNCMVGANLYLTPKNSQGFAPHYDDIEAFVLQIEGRKHWRVYKPLSRSTMLPRESSQNFGPRDQLGEPCLDVVLEAGDLLYFPRGYIHQANTLRDIHSLHITVSVYQKHTFADLLEILIPMALNQAIEENVELRRGLPLDIWQRLGIVNSDSYYPQRDEMIKRIRGCIEKVCEYVHSDTILDNAVDKMALKFQHDALPPKLTPEEQDRSVYSSRAVLYRRGVMQAPYLTYDTRLRLLRFNILRMIRHGTEIRVYFSSENSKEYHEFEENFLEIDPGDAPAVEVLIRAYPKFIPVYQLQLESHERNRQVAQGLWDRGILMSDQPLV